MTVGYPVRISVAALLLAACMACRPNPADSPLPAGPPLSVCEAGRRPVGTTVVVRGEFDGFRREDTSRGARLVARELCPGRGAGVVVANFARATEAGKLSDVQSRDELRRIAGAAVTISGRITGIDNGRLVYLEDAVVKQVTR